MLKHEIIDNQKQEWVVFVHGIAGSTKTWKRQIETFSKKYNLLLLDLPGHGNNSDITVEEVDEARLNRAIKETLDYVGITRAHFVGLSLGTMIIASFASKYPEYVESAVYGGGIFNISILYKICVLGANALKRVIPYNTMYKFLAWFMLPRENHKKSRDIFLREAEKLQKKTMFAWIAYLKKSLKKQNIIESLDKLKIKQFFISGDEDHCFIKGIRNVHQAVTSTGLHIIKKCGHICSIEKFDEFNRWTMIYLSSCRRIPALVTHRK